MKAYRLRAQRFNHPAGTIVYKAKYHDYGLASDDARATGVEHTSVTLREDGDYPVFTVPCHDLEPLDSVLA